MRVGCFTQRGTTHDRFEDALVIGAAAVVAPLGSPVEVASAAPSLRLAVCDGVGGQPAGHRASALAAVELARLAVDPSSSPTSPAQLLQSIGDELTLQGALDHRSLGMATTCATVVLTPHDLVVANVGDSAVLGIRQHRYACTLTVAHTHPDRPSMLTQYLGGGATSVAPAILTTPRAPWNRLLLTTDGLLKHLSAETLRCALADDEPTTALAALAAGAEDDVAFVVVDLDTPSEYPGPRQVQVEDPTDGRGTGGDR